MAYKKNNKPTTIRNTQEYRNAEAFVRSSAFYEPIKAKILSLTTLNTCFDDDEFEEFDADTLAMLDSIEAEFDLDNMLVAVPNDDTHTFTLVAYKNL